MLKRIACFIICVPLCFGAFIRAYAFSDEISAKGAVLYCVETGETLYEKNPHLRLSMASTTKIMTSLLALEENTPNRLLTVSKEAVNVEGTSSGLKVGDKVYLEDAVKCMLLESGNEAANVVALSLSGTFGAFAERMNKRAAEIGMKNTSFVTPSGLDAKSHYTTAYDMALLGAASSRNADFMKICSLQSDDIEVSGRKVSLYNHNRLLRELEGCVGMKTGFTKKSGRCLVTSTVRGGITLICVTLNAPNDWSDHKKLVEYGFSNVKKVVIEPKINACLPVTGGNRKTVSVSSHSAEIVLPKGCGREDIYYKIYMKKFAYAPVEGGENVGYIDYYCKGRLLKRQLIFAVESADMRMCKKESLWDTFCAFFNNLFGW